MRRPARPARRVPCRRRSRVRRSFWPAVVIALCASPSAVVAAPACWQPPVTAAVTDPFREPACRWCPGNRGIEYGTGRGVRVEAVAAGRVTFAGVVAGVRYVVVELGGGMRVTYGNLERVAVEVGDPVVRGARIGTTAGRFHLGARDGDRYVDPEPFIGEWRGVVRLIPADGAEPAPAPPPRLVCGR